MPTSPSTKADAFWQDALAGAFDPNAAKKQLANLPPDLPPATAEQVYVRYLDEAAHLLWGATATTPDVLAGTLVGCLKKDSSIQARTLVAAFEAGGAETLREAGAFFAFIGKSSNLPAAMKRMPEIQPSEALARAAASAVGVQEDEPDEILAFWTLLWVAAHLRAAILDDFADRAAAWDSEELLARVRKTPRGKLPTTKKKNAETGAEPPPTKKKADSAPAVVVPPAKPSEVKAWLGAHPGVDPAVLARRGKQKSLEKAAAIRALAAMGTPAALEVIFGYRPRVTEADGEASVEHEGAMGDTFADPVAKAVAAAWRAFDRRVFAERMFSGLGSLWFANADELADLTGIDAAEGLRDLRLFVAPTADLEPLARCAELTRLSLNVNGRKGGLEPLARAPRLSHLTLINGDALEQEAVDSLAGASKVDRLALSVGPKVELGALTKMPALSRLRLAAGERKADAKTVGVLRELVERGVEICLYTHEKWPEKAAKALGGVTRVEQNGFCALTRDASRKEALRSSLVSADSFLF